MEPALVKSCPQCRLELRILREDSLAMVCPNCRRVLRIARHELAAEGELPLPPLKPHQLKLGDAIRLREDFFVVGSIEQLTDQKGGEYTEYALFAPRTQPHFLEESAEDKEWVHYTPLKFAERPRIDGDTLILAGWSYEKSEIFNVETVTGCGEFTETPQPGEKYDAVLYEGEDGTIAREVDAAWLSDAERSRYFRVEILDEDAVRLGRAQAGAGGTPSSASMASAATQEAKPAKSGSAWTWLGIPAFIALMVLDSCDFDTSTSCEQEARSRQWNDKQVQECRNTHSGRSSSYSGGK
jgi:hypothetical protein